MKNIILVLLLSVSSLLSQEYYDDGNYVRYETNAKYEDIIFSLLNEIQVNGFIVSYNIDLEKNTRLTSKFFKLSAPFLNANKIGFCKNTLTLDMMKENPNNLIYCPLSLAIYELKKDKIIIVFKKYIALSKQDKMMIKVNSIIHKLISDSLSSKLFN